MDFSERTLELIRGMTVEELEYILYRYCGPNNRLLSEKKFGFPIVKKIVEKQLEVKQVEEILLGAT